MSHRRLSAPAVVAWLVAVGGPVVTAWLVGVLAFGLLHYAVNRWLLDDADGSVWRSAWTAALWASCFAVLAWWSQRRGRRARSGG